MMTGKQRRPSQRSALNVGRLRHTPVNWSSVDDRKALEAFLCDLSRVTSLPHEEQIRLAVLAKGGDVTARQQLMTGNIRLVVCVAHEYANRGLSVLELVSEGMFGISKAIQRFDSGRGVHFITYAIWWIKQEMIRAILNQRDLIRVPIHINNQLIKRARLEEELIKQSGRATEESIQHRNGSGPRLVERREKPISLDQPLAHRSEHLVGETIPVTDTDSVTQEDLEEANYICQQWFDDVRRRLQRNRRVQKMHKLMFVEYFGLHGRGHLSYKAIGSKYGISKQAVQQVIRHALGCLWSESAQAVIRRRLPRLGEALLIRQLLREEQRLLVKCGL